MTRHFPCDLTLMAFFLSFAMRYCSISDLSWIIYAAIPLRIPAVKRNDHGIVAYVFDSARTPNSFFVDCCSFEANCMWKRHCLFGKLCIQLVRSKHVCDQQSRTTFLVTRHSVARIQSGVQCPVSFGNSSASLRMCRLKLEFLKERIQVNYTLCLC